MKWINYHHLIYFKEIATRGSVSKASEFLKVGQPALSSQLKSLEDYLGVKLFERKKRKLYLTEAGKVALEYANQINSLGQELIQVIEDKAFTNDLRLSVGALDSVPKHLICDIVDFAQRKTKCFLSVFEDSTDSLLRQLLVHQLDVIVTDQEITSLDSKDIYSKKILRKQVSAFASPEYAALKKNFPASLNGAPCIVPTSHSRIRSEIEHYFHLNNVRPKFTTETQDTSVQKILAVKGDGVVFLPDFTTKELVQEKKLIRIGKLNEVYTEYFLIYGKRIIENPAVELILNQNFEKMRLG
ncbi:LysR substrate-binding domain-containing protein [Bacteriovoracaceae bacterium]|nr:LysR substrate-binding domain-containing protein [Bacteriovoracaceae bacterium]|tara:strand:- start:214744 stop:215640 length:897 start_codon:yes stop_codon:yes gene_type:complete